MRMRKKKEELPNKTEILELTARMKELVGTMNQFISEARDAIHSDRIEDYQKTIAKSDNLMQECDHLVKCNTIR